jgi:hypothetical protein
VAAAPAARPWQQRGLALVVLWGALSGRSHLRSPSGKSDKEGGCVVADTISLRWYE